MIDYNLDLRQWIMTMLPRLLRRPLIIALLLVATAPIAWLHRRLAYYRARSAERLESNSQVCKMRALLARQYPSRLGIKYRITTSPLPWGQMPYAIVERGAGHIIARRDGGILAIAESAEEVGANEFVVHIPSDIYDSNLYNVIALVEEVKLPSKIATYVRLAE